DASDIWSPRGASSGSARTLFFFSSRRRHTRSDRDWSSDVCSSDLSRRHADLTSRAPSGVIANPIRPALSIAFVGDVLPFRGAARSEERRVGKEWGCWGPRLSYDKT